MKILNTVYQGSDELSTFYASAKDGNSAWVEWTSRATAWISDAIAVGKYVPDDSPERRALQGRVDYWSSLLQRHGTRVDEDTLGAFDPNAGVPLVGDSPYPGLRAFKEAEHEDFLGREEETEKGYKHLAVSALLCVVAASGSGKSSFAIAGIIPKLKKLLLPLDFEFAPRITPGMDPLKALAGALAHCMAAQRDTHAAAQIEQILDTISRSAEPATAAELQLLLKGKRIVLFIDQFEELFSLCRDQSARIAFANALCALVAYSNASELCVRIITTMRTDHLQYLELETPQLYNLMKDSNEFRLSGLDLPKFVTIIKKPADRVGLRFASGALIERLASEAARLPAGLPLLQFALAKLWKVRRKEAGIPLDIITEREISKLPDVPSALGVEADALYQSLTESQKEICKRLSLELVELADFGEPLRRRRLVSDVLGALQHLVLKHGGRATESDVLEVIDLFVTNELLIATGQDADRQIEVTHEALFQNWKTFRDWVNETRENLTAIKSIEREAKASGAAKGRADLLKLKGLSLDNAIQLRQDGWLSEDAANYTFRCASAEQAAKRNRWVVKTVGAVAVLVAVVASVVSILNVWEADRSREAIATLLDRLPPLAGLDLTYTYARNKPRGQGSEVFLAHSLERLQDTRVFEPRNIGITLAGGGSAVVQVSPPTGGKTDVKVYVFDDARDSFRKAPPIELKHDRPDGDILRDYEVSPPNADPARAAVLIWKEQPSPKQLEQQKSAQAQGALVVQIFPLTSGRTDTKPFVHRVLADDLGNVVFSPDGQRLLVTAIQRDPQMGPSGTVHDFRRKAGKWEYVGVHAARCEGQTADNGFGSSSIMAASLIDGRDCPATARRDGTLVCPDGERLGETKTPASTKLVSGGPPGVIASYDNTRLSIWRCQKGGARVDLPNGRGRVSWASFGGARDKPLFVAVVEGKVRCWMPNAQGWDEYDCMPGVQAYNAALADGGKFLRIIETASEAELFEVPIVNPEQAAKRSEYGWISSGTSALRIARTVFELEHFDLKTPGKPMWRLKTGKLDPRYSFGAVSSDGTWIAYPSSSSNTHLVTELLNKDTHETIKGPDVPLEQGPPATVALSTRAGRPVFFVTGTGRQLRGWQHTQDGWDPLTAFSPEVLPNESLRCSGFAPNGQWLVVGASSGEVILFNATDSGLRQTVRLPGQSANSQERNSLNPFSTLIEWIFGKKEEKPIGSVSACAVADNGTAVFGTLSGDVFWLSPTEKTPKKLTERLVHRFPGIDSVSIDSTGRYAAALGRWQTQACVRSAQQGQTVRVWDMTSSSPVPLSNRCFPNTHIEAIGPMNDDKQLPYVVGDEVRNYKCLGCNSQDGAKNSAKAAKDDFQAKKLERDELREEYGI